MKARKLIDALGGCQQVANILNDSGSVFHTRQRIFNWYKKDVVPSWAQLAYPRVWAKGKRLIRR